MRSPIVRQSWPTVWRVCCRRCSASGTHRAILETTSVQLLYRPGGKEKPRARVFSEDELKAFITNLDDACRFQRLPHVLRLLPDAAASQRARPCRVARVQLDREDLDNPRRTRESRQRPRAPAVGSGDRGAKYITRSVARCLKRFRKHGVAAFTPHDLRRTGRTGRTGLARLGVKVDIAERVLNHARERIEATYDVHEYVDEKREALEKWAKYLTALRDA
jgi:integrase